MLMKDLKVLTGAMLCMISSLGQSTSAKAPLHPRWDTLNEPGNMGRVEAVAISPYNLNLILAGGDVLGVGITTNGGVWWEQTIGITDCSEINDFTFDPIRSNVVWVGTLSGPYKSRDGGRTWTLKRAGMPPMSRVTLTAPIQKVLYDPKQPDTLLAFGGNHRHMGYGKIGTTGWGAVWKSTDAGETWSRLTTIDDAAVGEENDGTGVLINDAGFAAGSSKIVFACSDQGGVYKSTDAGASFRRASDGLPNTAVWALALHPTDPNTLWVSLGQGGAVYKSTDGARTWSNSSQGIATNAAKPTEVRTIAVSRSAPNHLYCAAWTRPANVYRSVDGGATWTRLVENGSKRTLVGGSGDPSIFAFQWLSVDPQNASHVVGACEGKVAQSFDAGATWKDLTCVAAGDSWRGTGYGGLCCTAIAWNPYKPGQVFALGMDGGKLLRSDDGLWSWKLADPGPIGPFNGANDVAFAKDGTVYVATGQFGNTAGAYLNEPILKSTNWGATWSYTKRHAEAKGDNKSVYVAPDDSKRLWAIMGNVLYQSHDGGESWTPLSLHDSGNLWNLAADATRTNTIYVGAQRGIFKSVDGTNFSLMPGSPVSSNFEYVYPDPVSSEVVYAVSFNSGSLGGVYRYDGQWKRIFKKPQVRALAIDSGNPRRLAVVTKWWPARDVNAADGVWVSTDGGGDWTQCNDNLRMLRGTALAFNPDNSAQLILGTDGAGFYTTDLGTSLPRSKSIPVIPGGIEAGNYDAGGEGVACHCQLNGKSGIRPQGAGGSGRGVCDLSAGDWLKYSVNVQRSGAYEVTFRIGSSHGKGVLHLEANGVNVTGPVAADDTHAGVWTEVRVTGVRLTAGEQHLRLCVETAGVDIDTIRFE